MDYVILIEYMSFAQNDANNQRSYKGNKMLILTSYNLYYQDKIHRLKPHNYTGKHVNNCQN